MTTVHIPGFLPHEEARDLFEFLKNKAHWQIWEYAPKSRKIARFGPWDLPNELRRLIALIETNFEVKIMKQAFLNYYANGEDYCPYHRDQYGTDTYTVSLGATRDFLLKPDHPELPTEKFTLESGDLYLMEKAVHDGHRHSVPKRKGVTEPRISILLFAEPQNKNELFG